MSCLAPYGPTLMREPEERNDLAKAIKSLRYIKYLLLKWRMMLGADGSLRAVTDEKMPSASMRGKLYQYSLFLDDYTYKRLSFSFTSFWDLSY